MLPRMRRFAALLVLSTFTMALVSCSDDDDAESDTTTADDGTVNTGGEVDTEALTQQFEDAILGEGSDSNWHVAEVSGDEIIISPNDGVTVTEDEARTVCGAVVTVAFNVLPTAVVTITDEAGDPLITSEGAEGCHPVDED